MSDSTIGSQSGRQNLGIPGFSKLTGTKPQQEAAATPEEKAGAAAFSGPRPGSEGNESKQRLTTFLTRLENTWQLFNKGTREADDPSASKKSQAAFLDDSDVPTPASLKELRARASGTEYLAKDKGGRSGAASGPKESPLSDRTTGAAGPKSPKAGSEGEPRAKMASPRSGQFSTPSPSADKSAPAPRQNAFSPTGFASSRSFLATAQMAGAQMRPSDAAGRPGTPAQAEALVRQPMFSQSLASVNKNVTHRQVSGHIPVHNAFLDEHHEAESATPSPLRLFWSGDKGAGPIHNPLAGQPRLRFPAQGQGGQALGSHLCLHSAALSSARADLASRFAGKAIHKLLEKLYDEEDLEELDEEEAVNGLGLILRLGGEFTYEHSTRVLDLALELADEVGIQDKATRKEIKYGAVLCDIGEFDLLLQSGDSGVEKSRQLESFLGGQDMLRAGLLHDIGKVNIPPEILYKPGKLSPEEYEIMKMHPIYGEQIVRPIASLRYLCPTIRGHHERWDGMGYPDGLAGDAIPMAARIISVADVFDALSAERPYKRGMEIQKVRSILAEGRGTHFDPSLVDSFLRIIERRYPEEFELGSQEGELARESA